METSGEFQVENGVILRPVWLQKGSFFERRQIMTLSNIQTSTFSILVLPYSKGKDSQHLRLQLKIQIFDMSISWYLLRPHPPTWKLKWGGLLVCAVSESVMPQLLLMSIFYEMGMTNLGSEDLSKISTLFDMFPTCQQPRAVKVVYLHYSPVLLSTPTTPILHILVFVHLFVQVSS